MDTLFTNRLFSFEKLGGIIHDLNTFGHSNLLSPQLNKLFSKKLENQFIKNRWFTPFMLGNALTGIAYMLKKEYLERFKEKYFSLLKKHNKVETIGVISAGNIPLAAFHDFFSVLITGNRFQGKLSDKDSELLPLIAEILVSLDNELWNGKIEFPEKLSNFDKVIATGSDNSARYFEYYFGNYPLLLRKNRSGIAILHGNETKEKLKKLCLDLTLYFGLGCRSVAKLMIPTGYDFNLLIDTISQNTDYLADHHLYLNNLEYQKTIHLMNKIPYFDAGSMILTENTNLSSPISVLYFEYYSSIKEVKQYLDSRKENIQCVVTEIEEIQPSVPFGATQMPSLLDYPDNKDIVLFCIN